MAVLNFFPVQKLIFGHFRNCKKWNLIKKNFSIVYFANFRALSSSCVRRRHNMAAMAAPKAVKPGKIFAIFLVLILWIEAGQARSRRNQPNCNEEQQNKMNTEFQQCLSKYTKEHHEASGKATSDEDFQVSPA